MLAPKLVRYTEQVTKSTMHGQSIITKSKLNKSCTEIYTLKTILHDLGQHAILKDIYKYIYIGIDPYGHSWEESRNVYIVIN